MKPIVRQILFLWLTFCVNGVTAQQLNFENISDKLNLPSGECYNVIQDERGYIWITTDAGLCRYNGSNIKLYNKNNGLPENNVYFIEKNEDSTLTLITSRHRILELKNDYLTQKLFIGSLANELDNKLDVCYSLTRDMQKNIILNTQSNTYKINPETKTAVSYDKNHNGYQSEANFIIDNRSGVGFVVKNNPDKLLPGPAVSLMIITDKGKKTISVPLHGYPDYRIKFCKVNNYLFVNIHNNLIRIDSLFNYTIYELPGKILSMYADKYNGLWIGTFQNGVFYYPDTRSMNTKKGLTGFSVSGILLDKEDGIWCSTLEKGIFYCSNPHLNYYSDVTDLKKVAVFLKCIDNEIYLATESNYFYILNSRSGSLHKVSNAGRGDYDITDMMKAGQNWYMSTKSGLTLMDSRFRMPRLIPKADNTGSSTACFALAQSGSKILAMGSNTIFKIENGHLMVHTIFRTASRSLCMSDYSTGFAGCSDGLYKFFIHTTNTVKIKGISTTVTKILKRSDNSILVATRGEGLFIIKGDSARRFLLNKAIQPDLVFDMQEDRYGNLWIATNTGLLKLSSFPGFPIIEYNTTNSLPSNDVKKIAIDSDYIYVSTIEGLCSMPLKKEFMHYAPAIFINSVAVNDRVIDFKNEPLDLHSDESSLTFTFDVISFKRGEGPLLMYKLVGSDNRYKTSTQNVQHFNNLLPGTYELIVYGLTAAGIKSDIPVRISFMIRKPFWQTPWFITGCFMLFFSFVFFTVKTIIRSIRQREEEKTRINKLIAESQLSALQARMNPHFVFNAINSIQNYILNKNEEEAYNYLAKFSKLIRMMLNNSKETSISLHEELVALKLYVELEQLRFGSSFTYECIVSEELDEYAINLPVMLIQPYIENAIGHGLMNLGNERRGVLKLIIYKEQGLLKISIEDNGIGRIKANSYKKANLHQPVAMKLNEKRLEIIGKIKEYEEIRISVKDIADANGNACGTLVELYLPLNV